MRLLSSHIPKSGKLQIQEASDAGYHKYAILSHRWGDKEITLEDVESKTYNKKSEAYLKIEGCCNQAKENNIDWVWIDTCCIDKTSSAELSEAINSMFFWYAKAEVCYAYLNDVCTKDEFPSSVWFTRGWTLQELIAPSKMEFFNQNWQYLGGRLDFIDRLSERTGIPSGILSGKYDLETCSVAQRMSWAATRMTTRIEDQAYCLMGIFGINMPLLYGERENAFIRLQEEILRLSDDPTLFAWKSEDGKGLLAPSPAAFIASGNIVRRSHVKHHYDPPSISSRGICLQVPFMGVGPGIGLIILDCQERGNEDRRIALYMRDNFLKSNPSLTMQQFTRIWPSKFKQITLRDFQKVQYPVRRIWTGSGRGTSTQKLNTEDTNMKNLGLYPRNQLDQIFKNHPGRFLGHRELPKVALECVMTNREEKCLELTWWLLTRQDVEDFLKTERSSSIFGWPEQAVEQKRAAFFTMLISRGLKLEPSKWWRIMETAIKKKYIPMIVAILEDHSVTESNDEICDQALELAAKLGDESVINAILDHAVLPIRITGQLRWAVITGRYYTAKMLIERGAAVNEKDALHDGTPLGGAVATKNKEMVELLLLNGATFDAKFMMEAAKSTRPDIVQLLRAQLELDDWD